MSDDLFSDANAGRARELAARLRQMENAARDLQARAGAAANELAALAADADPTTKKEEGDGHDEG